MENIVNLSARLCDLHLDFHQTVGFVAERFFRLLGHDLNTDYTLNELPR